MLENSTIDDRPAGNGNAQRPVEDDHSWIKRLNNASI